MPRKAPAKGSNSKNKPSPREKRTKSILPGRKFLVGGPRQEMGWVGRFGLLFLGGPIPRGRKKYALHKAEKRYLRPDQKAKLIRME
jgi:hypothetical protein